MTELLLEISVNAAVRIVETLGAEKALELLYCTEDLQEAGGLMTVVTVFAIQFSIYLLNI